MAGRKRLKARGRGIFRTRYSCCGKTFHGIHANRAQKAHHLAAHSGRWTSDQARKAARKMGKPVDLMRRHARSWQEAAGLRDQRGNLTAKARSVRCPAAGSPSARCASSTGTTGTMNAPTGTPARPLPPAPGTGMTRRFPGSAAPGGCVAAGPSSVPYARPGPRPRGPRPAPAVTAPGPPPHVPAPPETPERTKQMGWKKRYYQLLDSVQRRRSREGRESKERQRRQRTRRQPARTRTAQAARVPARTAARTPGRTARTPRAPQVRTPRAPRVRAPRVRMPRAGR